MCLCYRTGLSSVESIGGTKFISGQFSVFVIIRRKRKGSGSFLESTCPSQMTIPVEFFMLVSACTADIVILYVSEEDSETSF